MGAICMKKQITVREFDEELWRIFRGKAVGLGMETGEALEEAVKLWLKTKKPKL